MKKYDINRIIMLVAVAMLSMLPSQAEPGISIVSSSTSAEQSYLLSIIGRIEVKANTISLISHEGECLATEPIDVALKLVFNTYSSLPTVSDESQEPTVCFSEQNDVVQVQGLESSCVVRVFSLQGVLVLQQTLPQGYGEVDCSALMSGYYILQVGTRVVKIYKR